MADERRLSYAVDLVLVINATDSMAPIVETVRARALSFHDDFVRHMKEIGKTVDSLRVRVVAFRDFYADPPVGALVVSDFFRLPEQQHGFAAFLRGIKAAGGGDWPENGLEALAIAIQSPWATAGSKQRQVIGLWTDAGAYPLEKRKNAKPADRNAHGPADFDELTDLWDGQSSPAHPSWKRLVLYTPDVYPWRDIANNWDAALHYTVTAGAGLTDKSYQSLLDALSQSV